MPMLHDDDDDYDDNGSFGRRSGTLSLFLLPMNEPTTPGSDL